MIGTPGVWHRQDGQCHEDCATADALGSQRQQCSATRTNPSTGDLVECYLNQGHVGPHQATDLGAQGAARSLHWS